MVEYSVIKKILTYGWQCASWTCWVGVNTRFIFDIRSCFFFHTMFWRKKISLCFFFGFTSRAKRVVFADKSWLAFDFHWWILLAKHGSTGIIINIWGHYYFSDKQQFQIHTFPYKMADFWTFRLLLNVLGQIRSWSKKKLVKTLRGLFQQQQKIRVSSTISAVHW